MQQFYDSARPISYQEDKTRKWDYISNSRNFMTEKMKPGGGTPEQILGIPLDLRVEEDEDKLKEWEDYKRLVEYMGDSDEIYFPFHVEIQTNSSLPLDKQSLANLSLRLAEIGVIDAQAVLETLRFPGREEIIERLNEIQEQMPQAEGGGPPGLGTMGGENASIYANTG